MLDKVHHKRVRFAVFPTIDAAGRDWNALANASNDLFLQRDFLQSVESNPPEGMKFSYLVIYKNDQPVGIALCQIKHFSASESIVNIDANSKEPCFFAGLTTWFKKRVAGWVEANILICGNLLLTGAHGFCFNHQQVNAEEQGILLKDGLDYVVKQLGDNGTKIASILIKDLNPNDLPTIGQYFTQKKYTQFEIQPNMVLHLPFKNFDAYLSAMSTKYRTRAKRAFKKSELLEQKEMSAAEVVQSSDLMFGLYKQVATNAGFNMVDLNEHYITTLHLALSGKFRVFGYYLNGELVSYCTTLLNHRELEAHFLGYNKDLNHEYQLYLNMLYDMIQVAFDSACDKVVFARTALEIKSSVGAVPEQLFCYLRHQNGLINKFTATVLDYLKPVEEWQQRHPFKD